MNNTNNPELPLEEYYNEAFSLIQEIIDDIGIRASHNNGKDMRIGAILAPEHFTVETTTTCIHELGRRRRWDLGSTSPTFVVVSHSSSGECIDRLYNPTLLERKENGF